MKRVVKKAVGAGCVLASIAAGQAHAERGLFAVSLSSGQSVNVAPAADRGVPVVASLEYGFTERWAGALVAGAELTPSTTWVLSLGPRATLFHSDWWTIDALAAPELLRVSAHRLDVALRVGVSVRYQLMWGVGVGVEASVRGRTDAYGPFAPSLQALVVGGLYIEA